jgi:hypothetical protein
VRILGSAILVALAALGLFAVLNWPALSVPARLSVAGFPLDAPPGLILLAFALGLVLLLLCYAAVQRTAMLLQAHRHARELAAQREIAERAELSRIFELRAQLEREAAALRVCIEQSANGLAASIGQLDDKLERSPQHSRLQTH